jgi:hypothetical protein
VQIHYALNILLNNEELLMDNIYNTFAIFGFIFGMAALHRVIKLEKKLEEHNTFTKKDDESKGDK